MKHGVMKKGNIIMKIIITLLFYTAFIFEVFNIINVVDLCHQEPTFLNILYLLVNLIAMIIILLMFIELWKNCFGPEGNSFS